MLFVTIAVWRLFLSTLMVTDPGPSARVNNRSTDRNNHADGISSESLDGRTDDPLNESWSSSDTSHVSSVMDDAIVGGRRIDDEGMIQTILDILADPLCREILVLTREKPFSSAEIANVYDIAVSTAYRKVNQLSRMEFLLDGIRISRSGHHTREYACSIRNIVLCHGDSGLVLEIVPWHSSNNPPHPGSSLD